MTRRSLTGLFLALLLIVTQASGAGSEVADAAMNKDIAAARSLIEQKADVNAPQADGATALHWAVRNDDALLSELLIRAGANVEAANRLGVTPMYLASVNGSATILQHLLKAGADPNALLSELGETPLMMAARTGKPDALQVLLANGADVNAREKSRGATPLMFAAAEANPAAVKMLLEHGAEVNGRSNIVLPANAQGGVGGGTGGSAAPALGTGGTTALLLAVRQTNPETVRILLDAGVEINLRMGDGTSVLVVAVINGHYELAQFLLNRGADPNLADGKGRTPLYAAIEMRNMGTTDMPPPKGDNVDLLDLIETFLEHGANTNMRLTARLPYRGGINPSWLAEPGATPFYRAAAANDVPVMRLLLDHGADPLIGALDNTTPLMVAAGVGWLPGISHTWTESDQIEALEICMRAGHDIHASNNAGLTALHGAAFRGSNAAVEFLVARGASLDAKDKEGRIPLNWAEGIYFGGQPPRREEQTIVLIRESMNAR
jgi:ankyrin